MLWRKLPMPPKWVVEAHRRWCYKGAVEVALVVYAMLIIAQLVLGAIGR